MNKRFNKLVTLILLTGILSVNAAFFSAGAASLKIGRQPVDAVVYINNPVQLTVSASGGYKLSYQWFMNYTDSTANGIKITGANAAAYAPSTAKAGTLYYFCKVFSTGAPSSVETVCSDTACVVVKAPPVIKTQPADLSVNSGDTAKLSVLASGSGTLTYQWYSSTARSKTGAVKIENANSSSYSAPTAAAGTTYYYCVVTNTDSAMTTAQEASVMSSIVKVSVTAVSATTPTITTQPASATVYTGTPVQLSLSAAARGTLSYQWYSSATNSTENAAVIPGATKPSYSPPTSTAGSVYYYCIVTNTPAGTETYQTTSSIVCCSVKPATAVTKQPEGMTAHLGDTVKLSVTASGSGTLSYQWYINTKNSTEGGSKITGETAPTYTVPSTGTGSAYFYCVVTSNDNTITEDPRTSTAVSSVVEVIILAETATPPEITAQPATATVYAGTAKQLSVTANGTGDLTYQWYSKTSEDAAGTAVNGATGPALTVSNNTPGTYYYYCGVTNTADTASGPKSMSADSAAGTVTVLPLPVITTQPVNASVCSGSPATLTVAASGSGNLSYQWYGSKDGAAAGSKIAGAVSPTYTAQTDSLGSTYYYCVVTNTDSRITETVKTAAVTSNRAKVTVVSVDVNPPTISKQPSNVTVTSGVPATLSVTASGSGTLTYQWYSNTKQTIAGASAISGATGAAYTPPTVSAGKVFYYCQVTNTDATRTRTPSKSISSNIVYVLVNSKEPTIKNQPASAKLYAGSSYSLSVTAAGTGTLTYQWYVSTANTAGSGEPIAGAVSQKYTVPSTALGTLYYYCVVTNTVKTASETISGTAATIPARIDVVVYPSLTLQPMATTIKSGGSCTLSVAVTDGGTPSYQWYIASTPGAQGTAIKKAVFSSYTVTSTAASTTKTSYYYCVVTINDKTMTQSPKATLKSNAAAVTITAVNAAPPVITQKPVSQTLKVGSMASLTVSATGSGTLTYQWYSNSRNSTSKGTPIAGATAGTLAVPTAKAGTVYYYCVITNTDNQMTGSKAAVVTSPVAKIIVKS